MSVIDAVAWAEFNDLFEGDGDAVKEIVEIFLEESEELRKQFMDAAESGDVDAAGRAAHSLKSTSNQLGAHGLAEVAADMEVAGNAGDVAALQAGMHAFSAAVTSAQQGLRSLIR